MLPHQHNDCIERVEKKMRVELHLERAQPCLCELTFKLSGVQLELRRQALAFHELVIVANAVLNADYRPIDDHIQMKIDRQDGQKVAANFRGNQGIKPNNGVIPANRAASITAKQTLDAR